jgi:prepilin-type N-terminal cleavage/methylation domain-containing protein
VTGGDLHRPGRRDLGFTLPELLISIVMMGLIASVVLMALVTSLRTAPNIAERADDAIALQGITTFLPPDVDSTEPGAIDTDVTRASGCAGGDQGQNVVHLSWSETFNGTTTEYVADYRFVPDGVGGTIVRYKCSGTPVLGSPAVLTLSAQLGPTAPTVVAFDTDGDGRDDSLTMEITTFAGAAIEIAAASKNPAETLPPTGTSPSTSVATTTVPAATTTTTTTTVAGPTTSTSSTSTTSTTLPPCVVSNVSASPNPVQLKSSSPSKLKKDVTVTATVVSGYCVGLTLQYDTGAPNGQYIQNLGNSPPYQVVLQGHPQGTELWAAGSHVLVVKDGFDNALASTSLVVNP